MLKEILLRLAVYPAAFFLLTLVVLWSVIRPPKITARQSPEDYHLPSEDVTLVTQDGLKLSGWFIPKEGTQDSVKRAIIIIHGYPVEKGDMLGIAAQLHPDFDLLLFDLRYFGKSEGIYTTLGIKERLDLYSALDFLQLRGYQHIGVFGFSLGGAVALLTAAEDHRIDAVAGYAVFSDVKTLGEETYSRFWIFKNPLVGSMLIWARLLFGESPAVVSPVNAAKKVHVPVFLIHTRQDEQISITHGERLMDALGHNDKSEFYFPDQE